MSLTAPDPTMTDRGQVPRHVFPFSVRAAAEAGDGRTRISGYAAMWTSQNSYGEIFVPGSFAGTLASKSDVKPLVMGLYHRIAIGKWEEYGEDTSGLLLDGPISDTSDGRDAAVLVQDGALTGLSVGFWPNKMTVAEPGETCTFTTPLGTYTYTCDDWTWFILEAELLEASLVMAPADDDARLVEVRSALTRVGKALPGLDDASTWEDTAYSMALLMGGRGAAAFDDLPDMQRRALYERVRHAYVRHGKTAPDFTLQPEYQKIVFRHDEREVFADRYLQKNLNAVTSGARGVTGPLSDATRDAAQGAVDALQPLLVDPEAKQQQSWSELNNELRSLIPRLT